MERLVINIPDGRGDEIKDFLKKMGVQVEAVKPFNKTEYQKKLMGIAAWSDEDVKAIENVRSDFNSIKPSEW